VSECSRSKYHISRCEAFLSLQVADDKSDSVKPGKEGRDRKEATAFETNMRVARLIRSFYKGRAEEGLKMTFKLCDSGEELERSG